MVFYRDMLNESEGKFKERVVKHAEKHPDCWVRWWHKTKEIIHRKTG